MSQFLTQHLDSVKGGRSRQQSNKPQTPRLNAAKASLALAAFTDLLYTVQVLRDHLRDPNRDTSNDAFELAQFQRALYKYMDDYRGQLSSRVAEM